MMIDVPLVRECRTRGLADALQSDYALTRWADLDALQEMLEWPPMPAHGDHQGFDVDRNDVDTDCGMCQVEARDYFDDLTLEQYMEDLYYGAER